MENTVGKHSSENIIQELMNAARTVTVYANDVNREVETIITSCHTPGTKGAAHKGFLLRKVAGIKRLAVLYSSVAKRYKSVAMKLADGASEDKVMHELHSYNIFIRDQIKSEQDSYNQILHIIKI